MENDSLERVLGGPSLDREDVLGDSHDSSATGRHGPHSIMQLLPVRSAFSFPQRNRALALGIDKSGSFRNGSIASQRTGCLSTLYRRDRAATDKVPVERPEYSGLRVSCDAYGRGYL